MECFECGSTEGIEQHHIIPRSLGGTKTIPLCFRCHSKVHDDLGRKDVHSRLIKEGIQKKRNENDGVWGRPNGTGLRKEDIIKQYSDVIKLLNEGMSIRKIANELNYSPTTVQKVKNILNE
jgi:ribosome-binding protein aMBF1 (putative translation factor)